MADRTLLPLETARRLAREAVDVIDGDVWVLPDTSESLGPQFEWICISLRVPPDALAASHTHRCLQTARAIRKSLGVLTLLAACKGFGLQENAAFWSDVLPDRPPREPIPSWARGNWSERRTRPRPCAALRHPRFRFVVGERSATAAASSPSSAAYLLSMLEMLVSMAGREQQYALDEALRALRPWVIRERLPQKIECGVSVRDHDADRVCQLLQACAVGAGPTLTRDVGASAAPDEKFAVPPVCVEKVFYSMHNCDDQHQALHGLNQLVKSRIPVMLEELSLRVGKQWQRVPDQQALDALRELLWETCQDDRLASTEFARWRFELFNSSAIAAVCSAVPFICNAHHLHLTFAKNDNDGGNDEGTALTWRWLAATLFHSSSTARVQALTLENYRLTRADVAAIKAVLESDWCATMMALETSKQGQDSPLLAFIRQTPSSGVKAQGMRKCTFATVKQGARVEAEPARRFFGRPLVTLTRQRSFRVLHASSNWICIQLPGYGCGYVQRSSVLSFEERDVSQRGLTALSVEVDDADAAVTLLRLVGGPLQHLSLKCNTFRRNHLSELMECCPGLTRLRLSSAQLDDFSDLTEASVRGRCAITSLEVNTPAISGACIEQLCSTLSDRGLAERCTLRELHLGTGRLASQALEELLGMLDANRTLKFLHVRIAFDLFDSFFPRFQAHRGDRIRDSAESKRVLAFLSAIGYYWESSSPMKNADPAIVTSILSFAGDGTRAVSVDENTDGMSLEQIVARSQRTGAA